MKISLQQKIQRAFILLTAFFLMTNARAQCIIGVYPGVSNSANGGAWSPDYIHGSVFVGLAGGTLSGIGYHGLGSGGTRRLMVYTDAGGSPGTLVAYTSP